MVVGRDRSKAKIDPKPLKKILGKQSSGWLPAFKSMADGGYVIAYAVRQGDTVVVGEYLISKLQSMTQYYASSERNIHSIILLDGRTTQILVSPIKDFRFRKTMRSALKKENKGDLLAQLNYLVKTKKGGAFERRLDSGVKVVLHP